MAKKSLKSLDILNNYLLLEQKKRKKKGKKVHTAFFRKEMILKDDGWAGPIGKINPVYADHIVIEPYLERWFKTNKLEISLRKAGGYTLAGPELRSFLEYARSNSVDHGNDNINDFLWRRFLAAVEEFNRQIPQIEKGRVDFDKLPSTKTIIDISRIYNFWSDSRTGHARYEGPHPKGWRKPLEVTASGSSLDDQGDKGKTYGKFLYYLYSHNQKLGSHKGAEGDVLEQRIKDVYTMAPIWSHLPDILQGRAVATLGSPKEEKTWFRAPTRLTVPNDISKLFPRNITFVAPDSQGKVMISGDGHVASLSDRKEWVFLLDLIGADRYGEGKVKIKDVVWYKKNSRDGILDRLDNFNQFSRMYLPGASKKKIIASFQKQLDDYYSFHETLRSIGSIEDPKKKKAKLQELLDNKTSNLSDWFGSDAAKVTKAYLDMADKQELWSKDKVTKNLRPNSWTMYMIRAWQRRLRKHYISTTWLEKNKIKYPGPNEGIAYTNNHQIKGKYGLKWAHQGDRVWNSANWRRILKDIARHKKRGNISDLDLKRLYRIIKRDDVDLKWHLDPHLKEKK